MKLSLNYHHMSKLTLAFLVAYCVVLLPMDSMAQATPTGLSEVLCNVVGWFTGTIGKALATLAIIVIGIGALMGKVSWGMAIIVGLGVGVIFGAESIVDALSSGAAGSC
jgi:type IV secretory pathway VirB2 component (pilin)